MSGDEFSESCAFVYRASRHCHVPGEWIQAPGPRPSTRLARATPNTDLPWACVARHERRTSPGLVLAVGFQGLPGSLDDFIATRDPVTTGEVGL